MESAARWWSAAWVIVAYLAFHDEDDDRGRNGDSFDNRLLSRNGPQPCEFIDRELRGDCRSEFGRVTAPLD